MTHGNNGILINFFNHYFIIIIFFVYVVACVLLKKIYNNNKKNGKKKLNKKNCSHASWEHCFELNSFILIFLPLSYYYYIFLSIVHKLPNT